MTETKKNLLITLALFSLSFALRLSLISKGVYHNDCLCLVMQSLETVRTHTIHYLHGHGHPLTAIMGALSVKLMPLFACDDPVLAVNMMSVVLSSLTVPIIYLFAKKLFDQPTGFLSAVLFSLNPIFLSISVYGNSHTIVILFVSLGVYFLISHLKNRKNIHVWGAAIFFGLAAAARIQDLLIIAVPLSVLYFLGLDKDTGKDPQDPPAKKVRIYFAALILIMFIAAMFYWPVLNSQKAESVDGFMRRIIFSTYGYRIEPFFTYGFGYLLTSSSYIGIGTALAGLLGMARKRPKTACSLLLWFAFPFCVFSMMNVVTPRYFSIAMIPWSICQAYILNILLKQPKPWFRYTAIGVFLLNCSVMMYAIATPLMFRHQYALTDDFGRWIARITPPSAEIISMDEFLFVQYYGQRTLLGRPIFQYDDSLKELKAFKEKLDEKLDSRVPVYITTFGLVTYDVSQTFINFMNNNYTLVPVGTHWVEDWHPGELEDMIIECVLYRVLKK